MCLTSRHSFFSLISQRLGLRAGSRSAIESRQGDVHPVVLLSVPGLGVLRFEESDSLVLEYSLALIFIPTRERSPCFKSAKLPGDDVFFFFFLFVRSLTRAYMNLRYVISRHCVAGV